MQINQTIPETPADDAEECLRQTRQELFRWTNLRLREIMNLAVGRPIKSWNQPTPYPALWGALFQDLKGAVGRGTLRMTDLRQGMAHKDARVALADLWAYVRAREAAGHGARQEDAALRAFCLEWDRVGEHGITNDASLENDRTEKRRPGRPSLMPQIADEFRRRVAEREHYRDFTREADTLREWARAALRGQGRVPSVKTIKNNLVHEHRHAQNTARK